MVLRGLELVITGRPTQIERAAAVVELVRPIWRDGQSVSPVDLQSALGALNTGCGDDHAAMGEQVLAKSQKGNLLRPRTLRQRNMWTPWSATISLLPSALQEQAKPFWPPFLRFGC